MRFSERRAGSASSFLLALWILIRVVAVIVTWLVLSWGTFVGYLTVPIVLLGVFTLAYAVVDIDQFRRLRQVEFDREAREEALRKLKER